MKLLHLASEFPPARIFGLGRYVHDLGRAQVRQGHEVHILTNSQGGKEQDGTVHGMRVHRIHFPSPPMPADGATQVTQFNSCLLERLAQLRNELESPTAVIAHDWLTMLSADTARRQLGGRLVLTIHDTIIGKTFGNLSNEDKFIALIERWGCEVADTVVAVSGHVRSELLGVYEAAPQKVRVVPCAVDPAWFQSVSESDIPVLRSALAEKDQFLIGYVGRLDPEKGVDRLLQAFASLTREVPQAMLVIAGKGTQQGLFEAQARDLRIASRVRFLGYVGGPALEALYKSIDVLVCPSLYEPFGIVPLEGMINRIPVLVSDTGGMAEIVQNGTSGLKVPSGNPKALANALRSLAETPAERERLARGGFERASSIYSWDRVARDLNPLYGGEEASSAPRAVSQAPAVLRRLPRLTAGIRVKDGERYAEECLRDLSLYVDEIVVLDDGSTDRTIDIMRSFPKVKRIVRWEKNFFHEGIDRNVVLALVKDTNPEWILLPDIDEVFEERFKGELPDLMSAGDVGLYAFLFCHFWRSRTHYRIDGKWGKETREFPIPRLVRNTPGLHYPVHRALGTAQIAGATGRCVVSDIRVKHYGHLHEDISRRKIELYSSLDQGVDYSYMVDETGLELEEWSEAAPRVPERVW
jgi:glycosyltransferase involved in cell wall biosynthesis